MSLPAGVKAQLDAMFQHLFAECEALIRREVPKQFGQIFRGGKVDGTHVTVAYPATGSPGATAAANAGKLGAVYPDGVTLLITQDGELSTAAATTTTTLLSNTAIKARSLWNGAGDDAPPAGWDTTGYSDGSWAAAVIQPEDAGFPGDGISGAHLIWSPARRTSGSLPVEQALFRGHFILPAGAVLRATLQFDCDSIPMGLSVNGNAVPYSTFVVGSIMTVNVPTADLVAGGANVLACWVSDNTGPTGAEPGAGGGGNVAFRLDVVTATTGGTGETIQHNGITVDTQPILDFEDPAFTVTDDAPNNRVTVTLSPFVASGGSHAAGIVPDPGNSAGSTKFLREDATWGVPSGSGMSNPMTAVGDIIVGGSVTAGVAAPARVGIGSTGQVLTVSAGVPIWGTAGAGSGGALTQLAQTILGSPAASITFAGIPGSYSALVVEGIMASTAVANFTALELQFNADTAAHYDYANIQESGGGVIGSAAAAQNAIFAGYMEAASSTNYASAVRIVIPLYAAATFYKNALYHVPMISGVGGGGNYTSGGAWWRSTAAITAIKLFPGAGNLATGTTLTLYGVA